MADMVDLTQHSWTSSWGRSWTLAELVDGWDLQVRRLCRDLESDVEGDAAWGAHDFFATLFARQRLHAAEVEARDSVKAEIAARTAPADEMFRHITEPDASGAVIRFAEVSPPSADEWWWSRMPRAGLPRRELDGWVRSAEEAENGS